MKSNGEFRDLNHKSVTQIVCARENFSTNSENSSIDTTKSSSKNLIYQNFKSPYTEKEINEFKRIIENALNEEISREKTLSKKSDSKKTSKITRQLYFHKNNFCQCDDDYSLCDIRSLVLHQYSLIKEYGSQLSPDSSRSSTDDFPCQKVSDSEESYLDNQSSTNYRDESICEMSYKEEEYENDFSDEYEEFFDFPEMEKNQKLFCKTILEGKLCDLPRENCKNRDSTILSYFNKYTNDSKCEEVGDFVIGHQGKSDLIGKWGRCFELVDQVLSQRDTTDINISNQILSTREKLHDLTDEKTLSCIRYDEEECLPIVYSGIDIQRHLAGKLCKSEIEGAKCDEDEGKRCREVFDGVCVVATDNFDDLTRFEKIGNRGVASLCRNLTRWTHCVTKTLCKIRQHPHIVIHVPSFSYPKNLRLRTRLAYQSLQNIQFGRLAWLANKNTQVIYVCPNANSKRLKNFLLELLRRVRPDICLNNLWIMNCNDSSSANDYKIKSCSPGIENLFSSPRTYRRLRNLSAGRQAFVIPGVMQETDVFVACELKIPIMGLSLSCQMRLAVKSEFIKLMREFNVDHPPSLLDVNNFDELCRGLAKMMIKFPDHDTWLAKINIGFGGYHTAIFKSNNIVDKCKCNEEEKLAELLMKILPEKLELNSEVYKGYECFMRDLEFHGGLIQVCPSCDYKTLTLAIILEHDTASPNLLIAAEVVNFKSDVRNDVGYIIPQEIVKIETLRELSKKIGIALRREGMVGFFGIDVVLFTNESKMQELWIVDMDPHYTNLHAFNEWINFCLGSEESCDGISSMERDVTRENFREKSPSTQRIMGQVTKNSNRYTVVSGKLRSDGLCRYSGNNLVKLCKDRRVFYDRIEKRGCILCPIDPDFRSICLISIYPTRQSAITKFVHALRVLHAISVDKTKCAKTNMLARISCHDIDRRNQLFPFSAVDKPLSTWKSYNRFSCGCTLVAELHSYDSLGYCHDATVDTCIRQCCTQV